MPIVHHSHEWGGEATCGRRGTGSSAPSLELVNCPRCLRALEQADDAERDHRSKETD